MLIFELTEPRYDGIDRTRCRGEAEPGEVFAAGKR